MRTFFEILNYFAEIPRFRDELGHTDRVSSEWTYHNTKTIDGVTISYNANVSEKSVLQEEIRLVKAHLDELLLKVLRLSEEA